MDYRQGKIYKIGIPDIPDTPPNEVFIGCTTQTRLSMALKAFKNRYNNTNTVATIPKQLFKILASADSPKIKIELIKLFPVDNRSQLVAEMNRIKNNLMVPIQRPLDLMVECDVCGKEYTTKNKTRHCLNRFHLESLAAATECRTVKTARDRKLEYDKLWRRKATIYECDCGGFNECSNNVW